MKSFFDFLFENEYIDENPMLKIKRVRGEDFVTRKYLDEIDLKIQALNKELEGLKNIALKNYDILDKLFELRHVDF